MYEDWNWEGRIIRGIYKKQTVAIYKGVVILTRQLILVGRLGEGLGIYNGRRKQANCSARSLSLSLSEHPPAIGSQCNEYEDECYLRMITYLPTLQ